MKAIEIIMIPVSDQQKAKTFYLKLGFQVLTEAPMAQGKTWIQMALPNDSTSIALMSSHAVICETDNIEKEIIQLKAKGIEVGEIDNQPWGKFAWLTDPDGNEICLKQK